MFPQSKESPGNGITKKYCGIKVENDSPIPGWDQGYSGAETAAIVSYGAEAAAGVSSGQWHVRSFTQGKKQPTTMALCGSAPAI